MNDGNEQRTEATQTPEDLTARFWGAYQRYLEMLGTAVGSEDLQRRGAEAYQRYLEAQQGLFARQEEVEPVAEAFEEYAGVIKEAFSSDRAAEQATRAFRDYVLELKEAWASVDADAVDAASMMAISQSIAAVAWIDVGRGEATTTAPVAEGPGEGPPKEETPSE